MPFTNYSTSARRQVMHMSTLPAYSPMEEVCTTCGNYYTAPPCSATYGAEERPRVEKHG